MHRKAKRSARVIAITGTPGSGKTTISQSLAKTMKGITVLSVNSAIKENGFFTAREADATLVADMGRLGRFLRAEAKRRKGVVIIEGHLLCEIKINGAIAIVVREHLPIIKKRLSSRGYPLQKIKDNVISEAIDYCGSKARMNYSAVYEIMSGKSAVKSATSIINGKGEEYLQGIDLLEELVLLINKDKSIAV